MFFASLPIMYGERKGALGRLLAQLLMSSGDTSILVWAGKSGIFDSRHPAGIIVFNNLPNSYREC